MLPRKSVDIACMPSYSAKATQEWDKGNSVPVLKIVAAASSYFVEYGLNFMYVAQVSPVTFAITDIVRRLGTIVANV